MMPSVTQVLPPIDFHCTPEQLEAARIEGGDNHSLIKMCNDTGETFGNRYLETYKRFLSDYSAEFGKLIMYETRIESKRNGFTGKPDMIFERAIVDLKRTIGDIRYHALQLTGYHILAVENKIIPKTKYWYVLMIDGDSYKIKNVWNDNAEKIFLACLQNYKNQQAIDNYFKI